jgi:hypothetical protein
MNKMAYDEINKIKYVCSIPDNENVLEVFWNKKEIVDIENDILKPVYDFMKSRLSFYEMKLKIKYRNNGNPLPNDDNRLKKNIKYNDTTFSDYILQLDISLKKLISNKDERIYKDILETLNSFFEYGYYCFLENQGHKKEFIDIIVELFYDIKEIDSEIYMYYIENNTSEKYNFITLMINLYNVNNNINETTGGKSQKLKKTDDKIKVLYKKKRYTRVIYVNKNNKKFVKINKQILELSKLKKVK